MLRLTKRSSDGSNCQSVLSFSPHSLSPSSARHLASPSSDVCFLNSLGDELEELDNSGLLLGTASDAAPIGRCVPATTLEVSNGGREDATIDDEATDEDGLIGEGVEGADSTIGMFVGVRTSIPPTSRAGVTSNAKYDSSGECSGLKALL